MELKEWILERFSPVVMVVSSPEVDSLVGDANGLTVSDLLRPHGFLRHLSAPVRTVGEHAYRIRELCLRFYESSSIFQPPVEVADEYLRGMLTRVAEETVDDIPDALTALRKGEVTSCPWYDKYRSEFFRVLSFAEHETFDHPVACLLVLGSDVPDPERAFTELFKTARLPPLMQQGAMENNILKHYLLLHDDSDHDEASFHRAEEKLRVMKVTLGASSCHLLRVNSGTANPKDIQGYERLWKAHIRECLPGGGAGEGLWHPSAPGEGVGARLTPANMEEIRHFLEGFVVRSLLPSLEARVRALNHQVTSTRKGIRNQLKTLLFRKSGPETPRASSAAAQLSVYGPRSVEGQMRQLADLAFMMQDYDTALSTFRLLASDFKADKAWRHYAAVQEMLGLTAFISGASSSMTEVVAHFKDAFYRYNSMSGGHPKDNVRYATRAMLLLADYCRQHSLFKEANYALMKAHFGEENLRAGLLLEQAAHCLLATSPPEIRKYAFHMVLAGLRYNASDQKLLSLKSYRAVLQIYMGQHWSLIEEHLNDVLGKQTRDAGELDAALAHFTSLLPTQNASEYWQSYYLRQFLEVVQLADQRPGGAPVLELPIPEIDAGNVRAYFDSSVCHADVAAREVPEEQWRQLEAPLLQGSDSRLASLWLDPAGSRANLAAVAANVSVAGEPITVEIPLTNRLVLDLELTELALLYVHDGSGEGADNNYVEVEKQDVMLKSGQRLVVRLRIVPKTAGQLTVKGMEWVLNGHARGRCEFTPKARRGAPRRSSRTDLPAGSDGLAFNVLPPRPRLEVVVEGLPDPLFEGELVCANLLLRNAGELPLQGLRCVVSSGDVYLAPRPHEPAAGTSGADSDTAGTCGLADELEGCVLRGGETLCTWPATRQLAPREVMRWPLWVHPRPGPACVFKSVWAYEVTPDAAADSLRFRTLRMVREVALKPCVSIRPSLAPSRADLRNAVLRLDLDCKEATSVRRLRSTSRRYAVSQMSRDVNTPAASLDVPLATPVPPGSRAALSFYVHPVRPQPPPTPVSESSAVQYTLNPTLDEVLQDGPIGHFHERLRSRGRGGSAVSDAADDRPAGARGGGDPGPSGETPQTEEAVSLVVEWEVEGSGRQGATHLFGLSMREPEALRAVVKGPSTLRHDFAADALCTAQVTLRVRNCGDAAASLSVEANTHSAAAPMEGGAWRAMAPPTSTAGTGAADGPPPVVALTPPLPPGTHLGPNPARPYVWCGRTRTHVPHLEQDQEVEVPLQIAIFAPGLYEVSDYVLHWSSAALSKAKESMPGPRFVLSVQAA